MLTPAGGVKDQVYVRFVPPPESLEPDPSKTNWPAQVVLRAAIGSGPPKRNWKYLVVSLRSLVSVADERVRTWTKATLSLHAVKLGKTSEILTEASANSKRGMVPVAQFPLLSTYPHGAAGVSVLLIELTMLAG